MPKTYSNQFIFRISFVKMADTKAPAAAAADGEGGAASRPSTAASASASTPATSSSSTSANVDKKALKENFEAFAKFGDKERDGNR